MARIERKFVELKKYKKKAFIAFITAGYPSLSATEKLVVEFDRIGVDIVELGVPFSDPMADGPMIQEASKAALDKKVNLPDILRLVKKIRGQASIPLCLMTYYNPVFCYGQEKFAKDAVAAGVDGVIIPDLPPDEAGDFIKQAKASGLDTIFLAAPTSTPERIKLIAKASRGFIYYVSLTGVTGARKQLPQDISRQIKIIKKFTAKPVCVGFGVSSRSQVQGISKISDGAIVGSAIVKKIKENLSRPDMVKRVSSFVSSLKGR
ncbi:MAG: tryptophan synthase subunit alpha [Candidatus Omnitrophota bacterium]